MYNKDWVFYLIILLYRALMNIQTLLHLFQEQESPAHFEATLLSALEGFGFPKATMIFMPYSLELATATPRHISNYPVEWQERYLNNDYIKIDPAIHKPLQNPSQLFKWHERNNLSDSEQLVLNEAACFDLDVGICMPISASTGFGIMALKYDGSARDLELSLNKNRTALWLLGNAAQYTAHSTFNHEYSENYNLVLSTKQVDLLRWTQEGRSEEQIADKMNLSIRQIRIFMNEILDKLKAKSVGQAIVIASNLKLC